jgi:hypothetical protein
MARHVGRSELPRGLQGEIQSRLHFENGDCVGGSG